MKSYKLTPLIILLTLAIVLTACASSGSSSDLDGTSWKLVTYRKNAPIPGTNPTLAFKDGQVSGNASCNSFGGSYTVNGENISFGEMMWTAMACMDPAGIMEQETDYMQMLGQVESYEIPNGQLVLHFDAHETMVFDPVE